MSRKSLLVLALLFAAALAAAPAQAEFSTSVIVEYQGVDDISGFGFSTTNATGFYYTDTSCVILGGYGECGVYTVYLDTVYGGQVTVDIYFDRYGSFLGLGMTTTDTMAYVVPDTSIPLGLPKPTPTYVGYVTFYTYQDGVLISQIGPVEVEVEVNGPYTASAEWSSPSYTGGVGLEAYDIAIIYYANGTKSTAIAFTYAPDPGTILSLYLEDLLRLYQPVIYSDYPPPGMIQTTTTYTTTTPATTTPVITRPTTTQQQTTTQEATTTWPITTDITTPPTPTITTKTQEAEEAGMGYAIIGLAALAIIAGGVVAVAKLLTGRKKETGYKPSQAPAQPPPSPPPPPRPTPPPSKAEFAVDNVHAAPGAELKLPVHYSCPAGCTLQLVPPTGLQAIVEPQSINVTGSGKIDFTVRLGSGLAPGKYPLALSLNGVPTSSLDLYVLETTIGEAEGLIPGYRLTAKLGSGGFSTVYLAERVSDGKKVAIKVPRVSFGETIAAGLVETFRKEAETWSKLKHPNIVEVIDYGVKPVPYIVVEYMPGGSLRSKLAKGPLPLGETLNIALGVAEALSYAHHLGVIHRDIKPENVLFDDKGTPKLTDFGLAKVLLEASVSSAAGGAFKGTLLYAAPEQIDQSTYGRPDWRTDIWQFGALLYELLTGKPPFQATSPIQLIQEIVSRDPSPPSKLNPEVPDWLDEIVMRSLAKRKEDRWRSIDLVIERLRSRFTP